MVFLFGNFESVVCAAVFSFVVRDRLSALFSFLINDLLNVP